METETRELLEGTKENSILSGRVSLICLEGKSMVFNKKETEKNKEVVRPAHSLLFNFNIFAGLYFEGFHTWWEGDVSLSSLL